MQRRAVMVVFWMLGLVFQINAQSHWSELPPIPDKEGYAGMFAGVSHDVLICAGGANFPDKKPWEGGLKQWYDIIYLLKGEREQWTVSRQSLPWKRAYGVTVSYQDRVILVGGNDATGHYADVLSLEYRNGEIIMDSLPSLPEPLANMSGVVMDGVIYIAGGNHTPEGLAEKKLYLLNLNASAGELRWLEGPSWPGPARIQSVAAAHNGMFYLFSGFDLRRKADGTIERMLMQDAFRYQPDKDDFRSGQWQQLPDLPRGAAAAPSPAFTLGMDHIVIPGGLDAGTLKYTDPANHPGFIPDVIAFNVKSHEWVSQPDMPSGASRVTAPATLWKGHWVVPNGEIGPGSRSPKVFALDTSISFGWQNWLTLLVYLFCMLLIGFYFSRKENTTADYFLAGGRIPWWAAGISIYGTQLSAITFMAIPAIVYATDWRLAVGTLMIMGIVPVIVRFYLPSFRRMNITTAYEFLESRFNLKVRMLGSLTFILLQLGRMGIVLYLPAIAISSVTGIDILLCIAVMGLFSTIYTVMGGIEAVVWTDVVQVVVLMGGAIASIFIAVANIDGGFSEVIRIGAEYEKFKFIEFGWDYTQLVFWVAITGFFFLNLISYSSDQVVIQRYLTVKTEKEAARSLWTNGIITLPGILIFFGLGTTLFVFYLMNPSELTSNRPDEILPYFVVTQLPVGVAGLVISGVFAASMSSLDSSMNSIATAYITDFHKRIWPDESDSKYLRMARYVTIAMGAFGTLTAMGVAVSDVDFIFDFFQEILGVIGGSLAGVFVLAVFSKKANPTGAITGTFAGAIITLLFKNFSDVNGYLYGAIGVISCVIVGWVVSMMTSSPLATDKKTVFQPK